MRKLLVQAALPLVCLLSMKNMAFALPGNDSSKITHVLDGNTNEWPTDKFEMDKETLALYAIDHDAKNLYIAMKITQQPLQVKLMMQGMNMYLDKKGKKREATGIEFPMKKAKLFDGVQAGDGQDLQSIRLSLAPGMVMLKTFGFENKEDNIQSRTQDGLPNIAFSWDEGNTMYLEYQVPLNMFGDQALLNGKPLAIGWKIPGMEAKEEYPVTTTTQLVGVPASSSVSRPGATTRTSISRGSRVPSGPGIQMHSGENDREQSFWTKYTISF